MSIAWNRRARTPNPRADAIGPISRGATAGGGRGGIAIEAASASPSSSAIDRFARLGRWPARILLTATLALILFGLITPVQPALPAPPPGLSDIIFYQRVIAHVQGGEPYYSAATREQRIFGYPLRPAVTVRLPTLAVSMAALRNDVLRRIAIALLGLATFGAWIWRLRTVWIGRKTRGAMVLVVASGVVTAFSPTAYAMHECWAGLLIALSLALRRPGRWGASLAVAVVALAIRELAAPYLLAMAVLALRDRRPAEALAWFAGLAAFAGGMALHISAVQPWLRPGDPVSPSWLALGGWRYLLDLLREWNLVLAPTPALLTAVVAPLALLGLLGRKGDWQDRLALTVVGYGAAFMFIGRPNNEYWGLMIAPLWPIGLAGAYSALKSLATRARA